MQTDYERIAPHYDQRYALHDYGGIEHSLMRLLHGRDGAVLEVGCGTGHWLSFLSARGFHVQGIDRSPAMLSRTRERSREASVSLATAEALPFRDGSFDSVLVVNALHHFRDVRMALREARRILRPAGQLIVIGLEPRVASTSWYVYDYFAGTRERDLERYASEQTRCAWLSDAGFGHARIEVAQQFDQSMPARFALRTGVVAKHSTSQLAELSDAQYESGVLSIERAADQAEARGEPLTLLARLTLQATIAPVPG